MYSDQLVKFARLLKIKNFIGVFPLNRLPLSLSTLPKPFSFIVNTDTSNLPGQHWLAIHFAENGIVQVFDPLATVYPATLTHYLARQKARRIIFNRVMYQHPSMKTCGHHCLRWLYKHNPTNDIYDTP